MHGETIPQTAGNPQAEATAPDAAAASQSAETRQFRSVAEAVDAARRDASRMAGETAPKLKQAVRETAHDLAYGAAFGAWFVTAFAREITPGLIKDGIKRGAHAGREAAKKAKATFHQAADEPALAPTEALPTA
jgi:hypothetical protein